MLISITKTLKKAFFPSRCLVCGSFLRPSGKPSGSQHEKIPFAMLLAPFCCPNCSNEFLSIESPICLKCGRMFNNYDGEDHVCGECLTSPKTFSIARAAGVYTKDLIEVIHCYKYKKKIQLARPLGKLLFSAFIRYWSSQKIDIVAPIPLHIKKFRQRGFNQAYLLIKNWFNIATDLKIDLSHMQIDRNLLVRNRRTQPQVGLSRIKRMENIKNAFSINDRDKVFNRKILLVDDVYTTGTTVNECAKVLMENGAKEVDVLTLARAM